MFRLHEGFHVVVLNPRKAKGVYPKHQGLNKVTRTKARRPIRGDRMFGNEDAIWLSGR